MTQIDKEPAAKELLEKVSELIDHHTSIYARSVMAGWIKSALARLSRYESAATDEVKRIQKPCSAIENDLATKACTRPSDLTEQDVFTLGGVAARGIEDRATLLAIEAKQRAEIERLEADLVTLSDEHARRMNGIESELAALRRPSEEADLARAEKNHATSKLRKDGFGDDLSIEVLPVLAVAKVADRDRGVLLSALKQMRADKEALEAEAKAEREQHWSWEHEFEETIWGLLCIAGNLTATAAEVARCFSGKDDWSLFLKAPGREAAKAVESLRALLEMLNV